MHPSIFEDAIYGVLQGLLMVAMSMKSRLLSLLTALMVASCFSNAVNANIPSISEVTIQENGGIVLYVKGSHGSPSSSHYVDEAQVDIDGDVQVFNLTESSTSYSLTLALNISQAGTIKVRTHCNLHGWSAWVTLSKDEEPTDEGTWIPGFTAESMVLGLILGALILLWLRERA